MLKRRNFAMVLISGVLLSFPQGCDRRAQNQSSAQPFRAAGEVELRKGLESGAAVVELPDGVLVLHHSVRIPPAASVIEIRGHSRGSTVRLAPDFSGKAAFVADHVSGIIFKSFILEGNRTDLHSDRYLPPDGSSFASYYDDNGIVITNSQDLTVAEVVFKDIRSFPLLVTASARVRITGVTVENSGSLGPNGRNNTTGGMLFEEGVRDFLVERTRIRNVLGNAIWTHSNSGSQRNADGVIQGNDIADVGRDAIQVGHATKMRVTHNRGDRIGFPALYVDAEHQGTPVALDTAGNVDQSVYSDNIFSNVDGQCIDLDGFHAGEVTGNSCTNKLALAEYPYLHFGILFGNHDPGMSSTAVKLRNNVVDGFAYGGLYLIGTEHLIEGNRFLHTNRARCTGDGSTALCNYALDEPDLLRSGIYLGRNGGRPAKTEGNVIRGNIIRGFRADAWCIQAAPDVNLSQNVIAGNHCLADP